MIQRVTVPLVMASVFLLTNVAAALGLECPAGFSKASIDNSVALAARIRYGVDNLANCCSGDHPGQYLFKPSLRQLQESADAYFAATGRIVKYSTFCGPGTGSSPTGATESCNYCPVVTGGSPDNCKAEYAKLHDALMTLTFGDDATAGIACVAYDLLKRDAPFAETDAARNLTLSLYTVLGSLGDPQLISSLKTSDQLARGQGH